MTSDSLLGHLLGHEGEGSIFAVIHVSTSSTFRTLVTLNSTQAYACKWCFILSQSLGWATALSAGVSTSQDNFCTFVVRTTTRSPSEDKTIPSTHGDQCSTCLCLQVSANLTEEGLKHWQEIGSLVFTYLRLIQQVRPHHLNSCCPLQLH